MAYGGDFNGLASPGDNTPGTKPPWKNRPKMKPLGMNAP